MTSSISNSETRAASADPWRRFCRRLLVFALVLAGAVYAFVFVVDPFDTLSLSPPFDRGPVSTNARYAFPALARKSRFDSVILGTSTSRLLRPAELDPIFGAHFVNLAMNSATAYEQWRLGEVFARAHPDARFVLIGLDVVWCEIGDTVEKYTPRSFPEWLYDDDPWNDYLEQFNLYAVEQAGIQFGVLTGLNRQRYGRDGYTNFLPDDRSYDPARAKTHLNRDVAPDRGAATTAAAAGATFRYPALPLLKDLLAIMPRDAVKLVYFVPYHRSGQPLPGSPAAQQWAQCKADVAAIVAAAQHARLVDFMIPSSVTLRDDNYWDPLHYRIGVATWLTRSLRAAMDGPPRVEQEGYVVY